MPPVAPRDRCCSLRPTPQPGRSGAAAAGYACAGGGKQLSRRSRRPRERPRRGSPDGGGARASEGRRPRLRSLSQPLRPVPGSRSGQNGLPSPSAQLGRDAPTGGRASERASEGRALRRGSAEGLNTASARSTDSALGRGRGQREVSRADEPCYITPGNRAAPA